jgi:phosphoglycolate phosphatase-like HAD superfamily hydrolase
MIKLFVWDFHGTLEKGNENASREITNNVLAKNRYKQRLTKQESIKLYGNKWYKYFEYLLPQEPHDTHVRLQAESFEWPQAEVIVAKYLQPNDYAIEVIETIRAKGHAQVLLSNTTTNALPIFIRLAGLSDYFNSHNAIAISAHSRDVTTTKMEVLEKYRKTNGLSKHNLIIIGDSLKDMELATLKQAKGYYYRHPGLIREKVLPINVRPINDLRAVLDELK